MPKLKLKEEIADFSQRSNPKGYFHQEIRHHNGNVVKITASKRSGPFYVRLYTEKGNKATDENSRLTTLSAAYKWAKEHLAVKTFDELKKKLVAKEDIDTAGVPDVVPDYDMAEKQKLIPEGQWKFLWIEKFPSFEWDAEAKRWNAVHHPFTAPRPEDWPVLRQAQGRVADLHGGAVGVIGADP